MDESAPPVRAPAPTRWRWHGPQRLPHPGSAPARPCTAPHLPGNRICSQEFPLNSCASHSSEERERKRKNKKENRGGEVRGRSPPAPLILPEPCCWACLARF